MNYRNGKIERRTMLAAASAWAAWDSSGQPSAAESSTRSAAPALAQHIAVTDGGDVQQAIAVAPNPRALIASTRPTLPVGSTIRTANGYLYRVAPATATDQHLTTAGGVKLYIGDPYVTPDALGAPVDGVGDDAPYFERAFRISRTVQLIATSRYRLASVIGLPNQTLYDRVSMFLFCGGATIVANSPSVGGVPEAIFTSAAAKAAPESGDNLYTGKIFVVGGNWTQDHPSVLFNGDRIYDLRLSQASFAQLDTVVKSFRAKGADYPNGYIQSLGMSNCQFSNVRRWVDAKVGFDLSFDNLGGTNCDGGIYVDSVTADPAVISIRWKDIRFQDGGCALVLGKVVGGLFEGYYGETNAIGDAVMARCEIWFKRGSAPSSGVSLASLQFQPSSTQIADPDYRAIRWDDERNQPGTIAAPPSLRNCWTTGANLITPGRVVDFEGNGGTESRLLKNARAPMSPQSARRTTISDARIYLAAKELRAGVYTIAKISVDDMLNNVVDAYRPTQGEIRVMMQHRTGGGQVIGTSLAVIDFVAMTASEGVTTANRVNDVYCDFALKSFLAIPGGLPIDKLGARTQRHFTNPVLAAKRLSNDYVLALSGYATVSVPNYGPADRIYSCITMHADALNGSNALTSAITIAP
jgi:hypothetical protein